MTAAPTVSTDLAEVFRNLLRHTTIDATADSANEVRELLEQLLGTDPTLLPAFSDIYPGIMHVNVQAALDAFAARPGRTSHMHGVLLPGASLDRPIPFHRLLAPPSLHRSGASLGLADHQVRPCGVDRNMRCIRRGLFTFRDEDGAGAIWLSHEGGTDKPVFVDVIAEAPERARRLVAELRQLAARHSPYKGQMFRVRAERGSLRVHFQRRPEPMAADDLVLPAGVLRRLEQHTIHMSRNRERLLALGLPMKRGVLLHGPPGTGKTHAVRYLISNMPECTVMILPPQSIRHAWELLPLIEPAIIVLDDVDLVTEDRRLPNLSNRGHLYEALDALDGLRDTADVVFVLTTNRADTMDPALAARPGRVDQTIELLRPDADCRRRLFTRYRQGLELDVDGSQIERIVEATDGVTASFFKDLLRRATVKAARSGAEELPDGRVKVQAAHLQQALDRMLDPANPMTRLLLGADQSPEAAPAATVDEGADR